MYTYVYELGGGLFNDSEHGGSVFGGVYLGVGVIGGMPLVLIYI